MDDLLVSALSTALSRQGKKLPRDPTHVFILYTAGALTRRAMRGHIPYAGKNRLWTRVPDFAKALPLLERDWQPYLDGKVTFEEAIRRYAADY